MLQNAFQMLHPCEVYFTTVYKTGGYCESQPHCTHVNVLVHYDICWICVHNKRAPLFVNVHYVRASRFHYIYVIICNMGVSFASHNNNTRITTTLSPGNSIKISTVVRRRCCWTVVIWWGPYRYILSPCTGGVNTLCIYVYICLNV